MGGKLKFAAIAINSLPGKKAVVRLGIRVFDSNVLQPVSLSCRFCDNGLYVNEERESDI